MTEIKPTTKKVGNCHEINCSFQFEKCLIPKHFPNKNGQFISIQFLSEIEGVFVVPSYQRGYRWGTDEVVRLLDDIYSLHGLTLNRTRMVLV